MASDIWQGIGWGSIIYLAALTGIDQELYEAAEIDGAGRWKQTLHVTIPPSCPRWSSCSSSRLGGLMNVGYEKIILLYNPAIYETSDVISSFVYRKGILERSYSYSSAVGPVQLVDQLPAPVWVQLVQPQNEQYVIMVGGNRDETENKE